MRTLLNLIWVVLGGFWLWLGYVFFGIIACVFIITIPAGVASFRIAGYALWPFGRTVVTKPGAGAVSCLSNVIWFLVAGVWLAIGHLTTAVAQAVTIIGIPLAIVPLMRATGSEALMGRWRDGAPLRWTARASAALIIALNVALVWLTLTGRA